MNNYIVYNRVDCICIVEPNSETRHVRADGKCFYCEGLGYKDIPIPLARAITRLIEEDAFVRMTIRGQI